MSNTVAGDIRRVQIRTTAIATLALGAVLVIAGIALVGIFERELLREVDERLIGASDRVSQFAPLAELAATNASTSGIVGLPRMDMPDDLVQVVDANGSVTFSSMILQDEPALWKPGDGELQPRTSETSRHGPIRVSAVRFGDRWVVLADSLQPSQDAVESLRKAMLIGLPPLTLALAILLWTVVGRTLKPVAAAVEHEEQLVGDVSHELRSPLAGLRVLFETEPSEPREVELSRVEAIATLGRLENIADQLLVLSRQEGRSSPRECHPVDLDEIVVEEVRALAPHVPVEISTAGLGAGQVLGCENDLSSLVANLLTNAARQGHDKVTVSIREESGHVELAVDDDGPGIDPEDRIRIFDRFTRLDEARSRDRGGAGLGLAIVRAIVDAHDGTIRVEDSPLGGARFVVRLGASTAAM